MGEVKFNVKTSGVKYICEKCKNGVMMPTGMKTTEEPPKFQHKCSACGDLQLLDRTYPAIEYTVI